MKSLHIVLLVAIALLSSCGKKNFKEEILSMQAHPIDLSCCEGSFFLENGEEKEFRDEDDAYKLIIYTDSSSCSPCFISRIYEYMETVEDFDSVGVHTLFLFEPKAEYEEETKSILKEKAYHISCVVISHGAFSASNPHVPASSVLHSFLLNRKNEVTIVGNPARNKQVKELMLNTVKSRVGQ